jgi:hypothetical protein
VRTESNVTGTAKTAHRDRVSIEEIARLAGHATTRTTEVLYCRELRRVITTGAEIMDEFFGGGWPLCRSGCR